MVVDSDIFRRFPSFKRGVIVADNVDNRTRNEAISLLLRKEVERKAGVHWLNHEFIREWDTAYSSAGINQGKRLSPVKLLLQNGATGIATPGGNPVDSVLNYISLKYLLPCGCCDLDPIQGNIRLGFARGDEVIMLPPENGQHEFSLPNEIICYDDVSRRVICRGWNQQNMGFAGNNRNSKKIAVYIDGIGAIGKSVVMEASNVLAKLLAEECRGTIMELGYLDYMNTSIEITTCTKLKCTIA